VGPISTFSQSLIRILSNSENLRGSDPLFTMSMCKANMRGELLHHPTISVATQVAVISFLHNFSVVKTLRAPALRGHKDGIQSSLLHGFVYFFSMIFNYHQLGNKQKKVSTDKGRPLFLLDLKHCHTTDNYDFLKKTLQCKMTSCCRELKYKGYKSKNIERTSH
jgi:hypothetical protein